MRISSLRLRTTVSIGVLAIAAQALSAPALAAQAGPTTSPAAPGATDAATGGDVIIVTGTRAANRTRLDTIAPVDVLSADALSHQGTPELGAALSVLTPSIDFPRPSGNDGSDAIRPAILRGLSADETLVLINGVRAHASSYVGVNGALGRGAAAVDLNTIPEVALESVEVLRDGASAQYGSDAIAGVVNLRLREADHGGGITGSEGIYVTNFNTARTRDRSVTGEPVRSLSAWQGFKLGDDGFLTVSGDYQHRSPTNRADTDPRTGIVDTSYGDPRVNQYSGWANFGKPIGDWKLYGWAGYQYRSTTSSETARTPALAETNGVGDVYPDGFTPLLNSRSFDLNTALGLKGDIAGWTIDLKGSYGRNKLELRTRNSANYYYGAATPTDFYDGAFTYGQAIANLDASKQFDVFQSLNVAWGAELRHETYDIDAGNHTSYVGSGAQGYGGLAPANETSAHRTSESAYLDLEAQLTEQLRLGAAGRYEHYSDFGSTGTGKVSARYDISPAFALRATGSTGFRAPSLQQENYTAITPVINSTSGALVQTGTFPSNSAIAEQVGGKPLEPERSASVSAGFVVQKGAFNLTVDGYYTHVRNALALSENLTVAGLTLSDAARAELSDQGVTQLRFFINGLGITTKGIDAVAHYKLRTDDAGTFDLTLAANVNKLEVTSTPSLASSGGQVLFSRNRIAAIEQGTPGDKVTAQIDWSKGVLGATARMTYYGNAEYENASAAAAATGDFGTGKRGITDLELRYQPKDTALNLAVGANNLFDIYPRKLTTAQNSGFNGLLSYSYYSPYGFNGRYIYIRAGVHW